MDIEKIKIGLSGIALGAFALFGIGFGMSGWVLAGTSQERADSAVVERLTPICVALFKQDPLMAQKLIALKKLSYDEHAKYVETQGWATMPGASTPDSAVAEKCGDKISG
jgi:hypothetical protein